MIKDMSHTINTAALMYITALLKSPLHRKNKRKKMMQSVALVETAPIKLNKKVYVLLGDNNKNSINNSAVNAKLILKNSEN